MLLLLLIITYNLLLLEYLILNIWQTLLVLKLI